MATGDILQDSGDTLRFGRFRLGERLGEGGFGTVFRAFDVKLSTVVALKVEHRKTPASAERFRAEFRGGAEHNHRNVIHHIEFFESHEERAISMELIEGRDLLTYMEEESTEANERQLVCQCVAQLAAGLQFLHDRGLVHRDVKPSNVLVDRDGRVVLLDFGLVLDTDDTKSTTQRRVDQGSGERRRIAGTLEYMAPEQLSIAQTKPDRSTPITPAADLYALGVVLYQLLAGRTPFQGDEYMLRLAKESQVPPLPSWYRPWIDERLEELALRLLRKEPQARPSIATVLRELSAPLIVPAAHHMLRREEMPFKGRAEELAQLARCWKQAGPPLLVLVEGEGGVGKSRLLDEIIAQERDRQASLRVLRGRCRAFEHVRFNAFDEILTDLQISSSGLSFPEAASKQTRHELFLDFAVEQMTAYAEEQPLLVVLDDVQWCDRDSSLLLDRLLERARVSLLVVASRRPVQGYDALSVLPKTRIHSIMLDGLQDKDARALASSMLGVSSPRIDALLLAAGGHPLLMHEMALLSGTDQGAELSVQGAIMARVEELSRFSARLLELVSVADTPIELETLLRIVRDDPEFVAASASHGAHLAALPSVGAWPGMDATGDFYRALSDLRRRRMVVPGSDYLTAQAYHARVRETVCEAIPAERLGAVHSRLAKELKRRKHPDQTRIARHHFHAAEYELARPLLESGTDSAYHESAYSLVADLLKMRLQLPGEPRCLELTLERSDALAFCGSYHESTQLLESLGTDDAMDERARREVLTRLAQRRLQAGEISLGVEDTERALRAFGPLRRLGWVRGGDAQATVDVLWRLIQPMYFANLVQALDLASLHRRLGQKHDSARHLALSLAAGAVLAAMDAGSGKTIDRLIEKAQAQCDRLAGCNDADVRAYLAYARGGRLLIDGNVREAIATLEESQQIYEQYCREDFWLLTAVQGAQLRALFFHGEHRRFAKDAYSRVHAARRNRDKVGMAQHALLGQGCLRHLLDDQPEEAARELLEVARTWTVSRLSIMQSLALLTATTIVAYAPDNSAVRTCFDVVARVPWYFQMISTTVYDGVAASHVLADVSRLFCEQQQGRGSALQLLRLRAWLLTRKRTQPWARAFGHLTLAQLALAQGHRLAAQTNGERAQQLYRRLQYRLYEDAATMVISAAGGQDASALQNAFKQKLGDMGWRNPGRGLNQYLPITWHGQLTAYAQMT